MVKALCLFKQSARLNDSHGDFVILLKTCADLR